MKIHYPFAAVPNQVCREGHGAINIAVLATLLSHGVTTASASTIAREIGCSRTSVFKAINYWLENGKKYGIKILAEGRGENSGKVTVYEITIDRMEEKPVHSANGLKEGARTLRERGCSLRERGPVQPANTKKNTKKTKEEDTGAFDVFWKSYPKKVGRKMALRFWIRLKPSAVLVKKILTSLSDHKACDQWKKDDGAFIPHPATWLNQERWEDELKVENPAADLNEKKRVIMRDCKVDDCHDGYVTRSGAAVMCECLREVKN